MAAGARPAGQYDKATLEEIWVAHGGDPAVKGIAAAIALAESGGHADARNSIHATGLWQIYNGPNTDPGLTNVSKNADAAVAKFNAAGGNTKDAAGNIRGFSPWTTYTGADTGPGGKPGPKTYLKYLTAGDHATANNQQTTAFSDAISGAAGGAVDAATAVPKFLGKLGSTIFSPKFWLHVVEVIGGVILLLLGLRTLTGIGPSGQDLAAAAAVA